MHERNHRNADVHRVASSGYETRSRLHRSDQLQCRHVSSRRGHTTCSSGSRCTWTTHRVPLMSALHALRSALSPKVILVTGFTVIAVPFSRAGTRDFTPL